MRLSPYPTRRVGYGIAGVLALLVFMPSGRAAATPTPANWTTLGRSVGRTGYNQDENTIDAQNVGQLKQRWASALPISHSTGGLLSVTEALDQSGYVYVAASSGQVYSLHDATGLTHWSAAVPSTYFGTPSLGSGELYLPSGDESISAVSAKTGHVSWTFATQGRAENSPTVVNNTVYLSTTDGYLYALNAGTGRQLWTRHLGTSASQATAFSAGDLFAVGFDDDSNVGTLYSLDATTGANVWTYSTTGALQAPSVAAGAVFFAAAGNSIRAVGATTGVLRWSYAVPDPVYATPALANGHVYAQSEGGYLYSLTQSTGALTWRFHDATPGSYETSPTVANGVVYVGTAPGRVFAVDQTAGTKLWSYRSPNQRVSGTPAGVTVVDGELIVTFVDGVVRDFTVA